MSKKRARALLTRTALAATVIATTAIPLACGLDDGYYNGPPYVIGHYTCASPYSEMPDYCELLSDGTYQMVPFSIWNTAPYGSVLSYSSHRTWVIHSTVYTRRGSVAPDVRYSSYKTARAASSVTSRTRGYSGMSYVNQGRVVYRAPGGSSYSSRSSSGRRS